MSVSSVVCGKPRGRKGGRKSQWRSPTKMMRLPACYEAKILEYAKLLDSESDLDSSGVILTEMQLVEAIAAVLVSLKPSDRAAANRLFKKLLMRFR